MLPHPVFRGYSGLHKSDYGSLRLSMAEGLAMTSQKIILVWGKAEEYTMCLEHKDKGLFTLCAPCETKETSAAITCRDPWTLQQKPWRPPPPDPRDLGKGQRWDEQTRMTQELQAVRFICLITLDMPTSPRGHKVICYITWHCQVGSEREAKGEIQTWARSLVRSGAATTSISSAAPLLHHLPSTSLSHCGREFCLSEYSRLRVL